MHDVPEGWRQVKLKDCGTWWSGGTPATEEPRFWGGDIPWISAASLKDFRITDSDRRVTRAGSMAGTKVVEPGTVLFIVRGMSLKKEFRVGVAQRPVAFGQDCKALLPHTSIDGTFLGLALKARERNILAMVDEAGHGTGRLPTDLMERLEIAIPADLAEQRRIVETLDALDKEAASANRELAKWREVEAGFVASIFNVDFRSSWQTPTVGALLEGNGSIQIGPFGSQLHSYEYTSEGIPVIMPQDIIDRSISPDKIARVSMRKCRELARHVLVSGDVVLGRRGDLSRCAVVHTENEGWLCGTGCLRIRLDFSRVLPEWFALAYTQDYCQRQIAALAVGSTMPNINSGIVKNLRVPVLPMEMQRKAISALNAHRHGVSAAELKISQLMHTKRGLADDLLSGRVRV
ncbi:restriction endonuclease subunit S [Streptomyces sp. NL15-2K]|uniref:restriction endonuclease subunit S n=1 Tax=Streptomyces sp. NL15-2K TaxID=376149 RepID=UPI000F5682C2|nr:MULTISPECIES: restriction endonuclease subunit S [Actinomycetes]WKX08571.1 restriction endonuclease subunit S [Kutzneria buriramensis]GCB49997.1 type I restriction-modification system [Streptomyces sp. NL15-2K]